jgi:hypothetical protein
MLFVVPNKYRSFVAGTEVEDLGRFVLFGQDAMMPAALAVAVLRIPASARDTLREEIGGQSAEAPVTQVSDWAAELGQLENVLEGSADG